MDTKIQKEIQNNVEDLSNKIDLILHEYGVCVDTSIEYAEHKDAIKSSYYATLASGIKIALVALNVKDFKM